MKNGNSRYTEQHNEYSTEKTTSVKFSVNPSEYQAFINEFDPDDSKSCSIEWIRSIEHIAKIYLDDSDEMKFFLAAKKLKGVGSKFLHAEGFTNWRDFKGAFLKMFPSVLDETQVHALLVKRRNQRNESYASYYYDIVAIGRRGCLT